MLTNQEKDDNGLRKSVDVRIVNLYQSTAKDQRLFAGDFQYNVFAHYEVIEVQGVAESTTGIIDSSPLFRAYCASTKDECREPHQTLLAFCDIAASKDNDKIGYTEQEVEDFWKNEKEPMLFLSMISLDTAQNYHETLKKIDEVYGDSLHLAYITFDYCNILLFSKGRSFQQCAERMLRLDFDTQQNIVDSITLYSFAHGFSERLNDNEPETFGVYLRFGISDMKKMDEFWETLQYESSSFNDCSIKKNWIAGRHDVGILCQNATLNWLAMAWKLAKTFSEKWYTSFILSILIQPTSNDIKGKLPSQSENSGLLKIMNEKFNSFKTAYEERCEKVNVPVDWVWLRWLHEASQQSVALLENKMTCELGVCLVPQFNDFFTYVECLWSTEFELGPIWNEAEDCFATMLTNTSILVDSMNHHSRQFISAPPVRTVAFEMPPKLMAYYTMVLHKLIEVLRDDKEHEYGFTITPQFTHTLNVRSLIKESQSLMGGNQFISIGISEQALYRMRHTTAVLTHEISHFVGCCGRKRDVRQKNVLYVELYDMVLEIMEKLYFELKAYYGIDKDFQEIDENTLPDIVDKLQKCLKQNWPEYIENENCLTEDLEVLLQMLPNRLCTTPALYKQVFECCWDLLLGREGHLLGFGMAVQEVECQRTGMPSEAEYEILNFARQGIFRLYQKVLQECNDASFLPADDEEPRWKNICDLFCETYADLQAILLLQLDWQSYADLFISRPGEVIPQAEWSRVLALAVTLEGREGWEEQDFSQDDYTAKLMNLYRQRDRISLNEVDVDIVAIDCLLEYLNECKESLDKMFDTDDGAKVSELRALFKSLSNEKGSVEVVSSLAKDIQRYRQSLMGAGAV